MARFVSKGNERFHEHDIRGKTATDIGDPHEAQRLLGHDKISTTEGYIKQRGTELVQPVRRNDGTERDHQRQPN